MTENEAIARIIVHFEVHHHDNRPHPLLDEAVYTAIKALEEVQQYRKHGLTVENALDNMCDLAAAENLIEEYRTIGTPEECREAVEKQTAIEPEKVNIPCTSWTKAHMRYRCSCGSFLTSYDDYCNKCGQKLKWGDGK